MKHFLVNQSSGLDYIPFINVQNSGGINFIKHNYFYVKNISPEECVVTLTKTGSPDPITLDYSIDNQKTWTKVSTDEVYSVSFNISGYGRVYFKGDNSTFSSSEDDYYTFSFSEQCNIGGKLMDLSNVDIASYMFTRLFYGNANLINAENLIFPDNVANHCYYYMFSGCTSLKTAPALPATTLRTDCYNNMFNGCTSLISTPELPATTLADGCYNGMFSGCTSLVNATALPATILNSQCYSNMFNCCISLISAPELPATTLAMSCYYNMFGYCGSLKTAPALPATTLSRYCYQYMLSGCTSLTSAPSLPATVLDSSCYSHMFENCISLVNAPTLPVTTLANYCYECMFNGCNSLVNAPELPATTLVNYCYQNMFRNCTKLNYIKAMFTTTPGDNYTFNWLYNVASTGTFIKNATATWDVTGSSGIPEGWTLQTA